MGHTQCHRANVAYSLYGVPKGTETPKHACRRGNFINSFFTNHGVEYFGSSTNINYGDATSSCSVFSAGDDDFNDNNNVNNDGSNTRLYPNYSSYTTSCSASGNFVQAVFGGAYCSERDTSFKVLDDLDDFNNALSNNLNCAQIYDASQDTGSYEISDDVQQEEDGGNGNNGGNGRQLEEDADNAGNGLFNLLAFSQACSILEYPMSCPDPFGAKTLLDFTPSSVQPWWKQMSWMDWVGVFFLILAVVLLLVPCFTEKHEGKQTKKRRNKNGEDGERTFGWRWRSFKRWFRVKVLRRKN
jgi:hypothetical protein